MDRRSFFRQAKTNLGGAFDSSGLSPIAQFLTKLVVDKQVAKPAEPAPVIPGGGHVVLRAGEPLNRQGEPFGSQIVSLAVVLAPDVQPGRRVLAVVGHDLGFSIVELVRNDSRWQHEVSSSRNVRVNGSEVRAMQTLPWQTILCGEAQSEADTGWLIEVNPVMRSFVRRRSAGKIGACAVDVVSRAGKPTVIYALGKTGPEDGHLYKFISTLSFDGQKMDANLNALADGKLFVCDTVAGKWIEVPDGARQAPTALTDAVEQLPALLRPSALRRNRETAELYVEHGGALSSLREKGEAHLAVECEFTLIEPSAVRTAEAAGATERQVPIARLPKGAVLFASPDENGMQALWIRENV